jgi:hypothetical protein
LRAAAKTRSAEAENVLFDQSGAGSSTGTLAARIRKTVRNRREYVGPPPTCYCTLVLLHRTVDGESTINSVVFGHAAFEPPSVIETLATTGGRNSAG